MVKKIFNIYVLLFLHGTILAALFFLITLQSHTQSIYQYIVSSTIQSGMSQEEGAIALLHTTHDLIFPLSKENPGIFGSWQQNPTLKEKLFGKTPSILIKGGACGNFVHVLGRSLQEAGYDIRIAQMKVGDEYGGHYGAHIVLETKIDEQWVVLDPLYDLYFINPDGTLASFADVRNDWDYFKSQTPPEYPREMYKYLGVRYTNWEKIPFITPALRLTLKILIGEDKVQKLSLRVYLIDTYRVYIVALLILYIPIIALTFVTVRNRFSVRSSKQGSNSG